MHSFVHCTAPLCCHVDDIKIDVSASEPSSLKTSSLLTAITTVNHQQSMTAGSEMSPADMAEPVTCNDVPVQLDVSVDDTVADGVLALEEAGGMYIV